MADFNYEEIKEKIKYGEQTRKEEEKRDAKAKKQIDKIEKIKNQLKKEEEKLSKIVEADENTKTAKKIKTTIIAR